MQQVEELNLPWLKLEDPETWPDPFAQFNEARKAHPWLARSSVGYVVTSYKAMREVMEHDDVMSVGYRKAVEAMGALDTPWGQFIAHALQGQNGELHKRLRGALAPAFTPREANRHRCHPRLP